MTGTVVLAFSGGLDTSYCVASLREQGWDVVTYYVHSGSSDPDAEQAIAERARELGARDHRTVAAGAGLWDQIVLPFLWGGARRQGRYPVLCADRYLIAQEGVRIADEIDAAAIAHGCTGMGNDQVRFDLSLRSLSNRRILAPIRDIQDKENVRAYEMEFLRERGFAVSDRASKYSVNENLLGATLSGGPIDEWQAPGEDARVLTQNAGKWPGEPLVLEIDFDAGRPVRVDGSAMAGEALLRKLNAECGAYGVGYDIYTGDTLVGLKGRIVFEAPGLVALETAATALFEATNSADQNAFRRTVGEAWCDLVYNGRYFDPLRGDLEAYLDSSRRRATGRVTLRTEGGAIHAVSVDSDNILRRADAVYAQKAAWSGEVAAGFTELFGQSTTLWNAKGRQS
jgi:argininosuccinate synthase